MPKVAKMEFTRRYGSQHQCAAVARDIVASVLLGPAFTNCGNLA